MEYQTPGFGVFGITGIIALCIVFAGPYFAGLAEHTEPPNGSCNFAHTRRDVCFSGDLSAGIAGIIVFIAALALVFSRGAAPAEGLPAFDLILDFASKVMLYSALALIFPVLSARFILPRLSKRSGLMLETTVADTSTAIEFLCKFIKRGRNFPLRPSGTAEFEENRYDVQSVGGMIEAEALIEIVEIRGNSIFVLPVKEENDRFITSTCIYHLVSRNLYSLHGPINYTASILPIWSWTEAAELYPQYVWYIVIADLILAPIIAWYAFKKLKTSSVTNAVELTDQDGFQSPHLINNLEKGCQGIVHSDLRPIGEIMIDGRIYEATSRGEWIPKGNRSLFFLFNLVNLP